MTPLLVALLVILLDQATKEWVRGAFSLHESVPVIPGFFHRGWHFPAFNVADSAICVGVGIYVLGTLLAPAPEPPAP